MSYIFDCNGNSQNIEDNYCKTAFGVTRTNYIIEETNNNNNNFQRTINYQNL